MLCQVRSPPCCFTLAECFASCRRHLLLQALVSLHTCSPLLSPATTPVLRPLGEPLEVQSICVPTSGAAALSHRRFRRSFHGDSRLGRGYWGEKEAGKGSFPSQAHVREGSRASPGSAAASVQLSHQAPPSNPQDCSVDFFSNIRWSRKIKKKKINYQLLPNCIAGSHLSNFSVFQLVSLCLTKIDMQNPIISNFPVHTVHSIDTLS